MAEPLSNISAEFVAQLRAQPGGENTAKTYAWGVDKLEQWLAAWPETTGDNTPWDSLTPAHFAALVASMQSAGYAPRSVRLACRAIVAFYRWAMAAGRCPTLDVEELLKVPTPAPLRARRTPDITTLDYLEACRGLADPIRCVCALLPMTRIHPQALCSAPLSGVVQVTQDANDVVLYVRKHGAKLEDEDLVVNDLLAIQGELEQHSLIPSALAELRDYSTRWRGVDSARSASPWLFPRADDPSKHVTEDAVHNGTQIMKAQLGARHLTPTKARRARE